MVDPQSGPPEGDYVSAGKTVRVEVSIESSEDTGRVNGEGSKR